jgi:hypothetical protein
LERGLRSERHLAAEVQVDREVRKRRRVGIPQASFRFINTNQAIEIYK